MKTIKEKIAVMQAFTNGKEIERFIESIHGPCWILDLNPSWNWEYYHYRVKKEPKEPEYIPFSFEDADFLIGKIIKSKDEKWIEMLIFFDEYYASNIAYDALLRDFTFIDGSPCGKLKHS